MRAARVKTLSSIIRIGRVGIVVSTLVLAACSAPSQKPTIAVVAANKQAESPPGSRPALFGDPAGIPSFEDMIRLSPAQQRAFLQFYDGPAQREFEPHQRVANYLEERLDDVVLGRRTLGARETLQRRQGNCLSLALVTMAIAELVDVESEWVLSTTNPVYSSEGSVIYSADHVHSRLYDPTYRPTPGILMLLRPHVLIDYFTDRPALGGRTLPPEQSAALTFQNLAAEALARGDAATSFALASAGLAHDPVSARLYNLLGVLHRRAGALGVAERFFLHSLALSGDELVTLRNLHRLLAEQGRNAGVRRLHARILSLPDPDPYPLTRMGDAALSADEHAVARDFYRRARQVAPYLHEVYWKLSLAELEMGHETNAKRAVSRAMELARSAGKRDFYEARLERLESRESGDRIGSQVRGSGSPRRSERTGHGRGCLETSLRRSRLRNMVVRQLFECGFREQETLEQLDAQVPKASQFSVGLHPLGDHPDFHLADGLENSADDGLARRIRIDVAHKFHVELDDVGLELGQKVQPGESRAEIVDGRQETDLAVVGDDVPEMRDALDALALGDLEDDALGREAVLPGCLQRRADAPLGGVDGVRHEIDAEIALDAQPGGQLDGLDSADLVEPVLVRGIDGFEHGAGRLSAGATHERLIGEHLVGSQVDDRLEGHAEIETQRFGAQALAATQIPKVRWFPVGCLFVH